MKSRIVAILIFFSYISSDGQFFIPNAFTPDGDNLNDYFIVNCLEKDSLSTFSMKIFNHSGQQVFTSNDIDQPWLGGAEYYSPSTIFHYQIQILKVNSKEPEVIQGHVLLIR